MIAFGREQICLVTGASSGLGQATSLLLNKLGATVIASGRDLDRLQRNKEHAADPQSYCLEPLDLLEDLDGLPGWIKSLRERYGKLWGLVPAAGYALPMPLREYDRAKSARAFDLHFHAPVLLAKGFADRRNNSGKGSSIVFLSSTAAVYKGTGLVAYGAAKAAIVAAAGAISRELAGQGIRVNSVMPAIVETPLTNDYLADIPQATRQTEVAKYPFGLGQPEDVAGLICYLLSDQAKWITGQNYILEGGRFE